MKNQLLITVLLLLLTLTGCKKPIYYGEYKFSGYCIDACTREPISGFLVEYSNRDVYFNTTTDSNGFFKLRGTYQFEYNEWNIPEPGTYSISDPSGTHYQCGEFHINRHDTIGSDSIYFFQKVNALYTIRLDSNKVTSSSDTIFVRFRENCFGQILPSFVNSRKTDSSSIYFTYHKYYVGPFEDGQVIDTIITLLYPHSGVASDFFWYLQYTYIENNRFPTSFKAVTFSSDELLSKAKCYEYEPIEIRIE